MAVYSGPYSTPSSELRHIPCHACLRATDEIQLRGILKTNHGKCLPSVGFFTDKVLFLTHGLCGKHRYWQGPGQEVWVVQQVVGKKDTFVLEALDRESGDWGLSLSSSRVFLCDLNKLFNFTALQLITRMMMLPFPYHLFCLLWMKSLWAKSYVLPDLCTGLNRMGPDLHKASGQYYYTPFITMETQFWVI